MAEKTREAGFYTLTGLTFGTDTYTQCADCGFKAAGPIFNAVFGIDATSMAEIALYLHARWAAEPETQADAEITYSEHGRCRDCGWEA